MLYISIALNVENVFARLEMILFKETIILERYDKCVKQVPDFTSQFFDGTPPCTIPGIFVG